MIVDIYETVMPPSKPNKLICTLRWDEENERIEVLKGKRFALQLFKDRILDKGTPYREGHRQYIQYSDGKRFIERLDRALIGSYIYAIRRA